MPIESSVDMDEKIVYSTCTGEMSAEDFVEYVKNTWSDHKYYGFNELFDVTQGDWSDFNYGYLFAVAKRAAILPTIDPDSKFAWVVLEGKQRQLTDFYKAAKTMNAGRPGRTLEAFYSREKALDWLRSES